MIRLTLSTSKEPEIHLFNKSTILMGSDSQMVDLILPGSNIQDIHLKIAEINHSYYLYNCPHDPFVSLNGHPFGKKIINSGDLITIDSFSILFETIHIKDKSEKKREDNPSKNIGCVQPEKSEQKESLLDIPFEEDVEGLKDDEIEIKSLENYLLELEKNDIEEPKKNKKKEFEKKSSSLKDDYLRDLEEDEDPKKSHFVHPVEANHLFHAWKWILLFIFSLLSVSGIIGSIIYLKVTDKTEVHEIRAAQAVADVAIALMHAQLNHLKPHNHNWSDVDFLKTNLQAILPDTHSFSSQLDSQGQFNCCPYSLRIYTNSELSHFLLIAQPAPSLLNWMIPQSLIVLDSHLMELHILKDVRGLNRLLANPDPLEGSNGKEITSLIKKEALIRLASLANDSSQQDFSPAKNLGWVRPGAENLIYNAPRYYLLGHHVVEKAMALATSKGKSQEVSELKQAIENISILDPYVLYTDLGKKSALLVRKGVKLFAPNDKLLFGYILFNAQGRIHEVNLLKDDEELKEPIVFGSKDTEYLSLNNEEEIDSSELLLDEYSTVDTNHPIYIHLQSLIAARDNEVRPLVSSLVNLISEELHTPRSQFFEEFQNFCHIYLLANLKHKNTIKTALDNLYHQYDDMSTQQFLNFVKALNLENFVQKNGQIISIQEEKCHQCVKDLMINIENSRSLEELDVQITMLNIFLNLDYIKNPDELLKYQNKVRNLILDKLELFLAKDSNPPLKISDEETLDHILSLNHFIHPEEKEFFLKEFKERFKEAEEE